MSRTADILQDAKTDLFQVEATLASIDDSVPEMAVTLKQQALNSAHSVIERMKLFERYLENELFEKI